MYKIWLNIDSLGNITNSVGGHEIYAVGPLSGEGNYTFYFYVSESVFKNIGLYKVINGSLIKK